MRHVQDLINLGKGSTVHLMGFGTTLCGAVHEYEAREGVKVQRLYEVNKPVGCKGCTKALEMVLRRELSKMSIGELENVSSYIHEIRKDNGSGS